MKHKFDVVWARSTREADAIRRCEFCGERGHVAARCPNRDWNLAAWQEWCASRRDRHVIQHVAGDGGGDDGE